MSFDALVEEIKQRYGYQSLLRASQLVRVHETLKTGIDALDVLLCGGLLIGATHSISGQPTSGATSLTYHVVASVQAQEIPVVYVNMADLFDPPTAASMGVQVEHLLFINPLSLKNVLFLIQTLAQHRLACLIVVDTPTHLPLSQLKPTLRQSAVTLLTLSPQPIPHMQVELHCKRRIWHFEAGDVVRFTGEVALHRHPFLPPSRTQITFSVPKEDAHG